MAVSGTGILEDPYVVTTYADLVDTATIPSCYIKIGNDINIADEYPNGDMPTLVLVSCVIDGDGKKISNWYKKSDFIITFNTGDTQIHDLEINNIVNIGYISFKFVGSNSNYHLVDCKIRGKMKRLQESNTNEGSNYNWLRCSIYVETSGSDGAIVVPYEYAGFKDCYIKVKQSGLYLFNTSTNSLVESCYIKSNRYFGREMLTNCACELTTDQSATISASASMMNIIDGTKAPNITCSSSSGYASIPTADWLNTEVLAAAGFNCG